ncbi:MAG: PASTA domain-containing protein [Spirochaetes bacterium]|nr:PASTA domain-containing protein [Spirochaetota bacterium]
MFDFLYSIFSKLKKILPDGMDDQNTRFFKIMIYVVTGLLLFMVLSGILAFMLTLQSAEEVMIPDVTGIKLEDALIAIQDRGLNGRIQLRHSFDTERGSVIEQVPRPGTIKRVGNQVVLRVSRGAIIDNVENYVGWRVADLETHLQTLAITHGPLLRIAEPLIRINSDRPEGTILEQKPLPGTPLVSGVVTELALVVSMGPQGQTFSPPSFTDMDFMTAMQRAALHNLPFIFTQREPRRGERPGIVVEQRPGHGERVPIGTIIQLTVTPPAPAGNRIFGILKRTLPEQPVAVDTAFYVISQDGIKQEIFRMPHRGGPFAVPYFEEEGTVLVISMMGRDQVHFVVSR